MPKATTALEVDPKRPITDWCLSTTTQAEKGSATIRNAFFKREKRIKGMGYVKIKVRPCGINKGGSLKPLVNLGTLYYAELLADDISYRLVCEGGEAIIRVGRKDDFQGARPVLFTSGHAPNHAFDE